MIDILATVFALVGIAAIAYGIGHKDGRDAEFAERWDSAE